METFASKVIFPTSGVEISLVFFLLDLKIHAYRGKSWDSSPNGKGLQFVTIIILIDL